MNFTITKDQEFLKAATQYVNDIVLMKVDHLNITNSPKIAGKDLKDVQARIRKGYVDYFVEKFNEGFESTIADIRKNLGHFFMDNIMEGIDIPNFKETLTAEPWDILSYLDSPKAKEAVLNMMHSHLATVTETRNAALKKKGDSKNNPFAGRAKPKKSSVIWHPVIDRKKDKTKFITIEDSNFGKLNMVFGGGILYFSAKDLAKILKLPDDYTEQTISSDAENGVSTVQCIKEGMMAVDIFGAVFIMQDAIIAGLSEDEAAAFMNWMISTIIPQAYAMENIKDTIKGSIDDVIEEMFGDFDIFGKALW